MRLLGRNRAKRLAADADLSTHPAGNRNFQLYAEVKSRFEAITHPKIGDRYGSARLEHCVATAIAALGTSDEATPVQEIPAEFGSPATLPIQSETCLTIHGVYNYDLKSCFLVATAVFACFCSIVGEELVCVGTQHQRQGPADS